MRNTTAGIKAEIAKGVFRPHTALTNMALAYYQNASNYFAKALFPTLPYAGFLCQLSLRRSSLLKM